MLCDELNFQQQISKSNIISHHVGTYLCGTLSKFFKGLSPASGLLIFGIMLKNVHTVSDAGIWTHDLLNIISSNNHQTTAPDLGTLYKFTVF